MPLRTKVVIFEPNKKNQDFLHKQLDALEIIFTDSIEETQTKLVDDDDGTICAIAITVPEPIQILKILPEVERMRSSFLGPLIAFHKFQGTRRALREAGCDHECDTQDLPQNLLETLGLCSQIDSASF